MNGERPLQNHGSSNCSNQLRINDEFAQLGGVYYTPLLDSPRSPMELSTPFRPLTMLPAAVLACRLSWLSTANQSSVCVKQQPGWIWVSRGWCARPRTRAYGRCA